MPDINTNPLTPSQARADAPTNLPTGTGMPAGFSNQSGNVAPPTPPTPPIAPPPKPPITSSFPPKMVVPVSSDKLSQLFSDSDESVSPSLGLGRSALPKEGSPRIESQRLGVPDEGYAVTQDLLNERLDVEQTMTEDEPATRVGMKSLVTIIAIIIAVISIGASVGIFMWYSSLLAGSQSADQELQAQLDDAQLELTNANSQISSLESAVSDLESELTAGATCPAVDGNGVAYKEPKSGWETYFPKNAATTLIGNAKSEVEGKIGKAPIAIKDLGAAIHKEVWIYLPSGMSEDALYVYFSNDKVLKGGLEKFTGLTSKCPIIGF